jgi:RNA polymerase sigma factor (sigma-70 family)
MTVLAIKPEHTQQLDDATVVSRVRSGEKELFEILMRRYNQRLFRVVRSYIHDGDDINDAMQDTWLKAFDKLYQFGGNAAFSTWLIRIGINEALQKIRKNKHRTINEGIELDNVIQMPASSQTIPETIAMRSEMKLLIEKAVDELPSKYRAVYVMKEIEGMDNAEIAQALALSDSNVKVRLHRARNLMKDALLRLSSDAEIFEFGNKHCDRLVQVVMSRI